MTRKPKCHIGKDRFDYKNLKLCTVKSINKNIKQATNQEKTICNI